MFLCILLLKCATQGCKLWPTSVQCFSPISCHWNKALAKHSFDELVAQCASVYIRLQLVSINLYCWLHGTTSISSLCPVSSPITENYILKVYFGHCAGLNPFCHNVYLSKPLKHLSTLLPNLKIILKVSCIHALTPRLCFNTKIDDVVGMTEYLKNKTVVVFHLYDY